MTEAPPVAASVLMAALLFNLKTSDVLGSPLVTFVVCGILMPLLYSSFWLVIPGGRTAIRDVWTDLSSAFSRKGEEG